MVPYHDINDFFYSGHISTASVLTYGIYQLRRMHPDSKFLKYWVYFWLFFKLPYTWIMMTWTRTHFFIDLTCGAAMGWIVLHFVEKNLSYYLDICVMGLRAKDRHLLFYVACPICGWSNERAIKYLNENEKGVQAFAFRKLYWNKTKAKKVNGQDEVEALLSKEVINSSSKTTDSGKRRKMKENKKNN